MPFEDLPDESNEKNLFFDQGDDHEPTEEDIESSEIDRQIAAEAENTEIMRQIAAQEPTEDDLDEAEIERQIAAQESP